jgi:RNA polymerase sigma-70 factor (ECF subfamily)
MVFEQLQKICIIKKGADYISQEEYLKYLLEQYQNLIYSICLKSVGNPFDAEDLTQEVFLSAYKNLSRFDGAYEKAWLSKIAVRKCLDFLKAAGRRSVPTEDSYFTQIADTSSTPENLYLKTDSDLQVYALIQQLKSPYREVAVSHFCMQLSVAEIARQTGKNPKTIQTQLYRSKAMLKKLLAAQGNIKERSR